MFSLTVVFPFLVYDHLAEFGENDEVLFDGE